MGEADTEDRTRALVRASGRGLPLAGASATCYSLYGEGPSRASPAVCSPHWWQVCLGQVCLCPHHTWGHGQRQGKALTDAAPQSNLVMYRWRKDSGWCKKETRTRARIIAQMWSFSRSVDHTVWITWTCGTRGRR